MRQEIRDHVYEIDNDQLNGRFAVVCSMEWQQVENEPYTWGHGRGHDTECEATFMQVQIGELSLTRDQAVLAFGEEEIAKIEQHFAEEFLDT